MGIVNAVMVPHPPIIIPEVGRGEEKKIQATTDAYLAAAKFVANAWPETIIVTTPHSVMYADWFHISPGESATGNFDAFGAGKVELSANYDEELRDEICRMAREAEFPAGSEGERDGFLDHATMIPLYFLKKAYENEPLPPIVRVGLSGLSLDSHYALGIMIRAAAEKLGRRVSVVASGDLSHKLKSDGPYGFNSAGPKYDEKIMDVMGRAAFGELFSFDEEFCDAAGECGHRSFTIMAGCFDGTAVKSERLSHEGTFGVGYGVCLFTPEGPDETRHFLQAEEKREAGELRSRKENEDEYVRLARLSVETYIKTGRKAAEPSGLPEEMTGRRAGVFVSLHMNGQLRGCIGTISATTGSVAHEILQNGVSACSRDPRFAPVTEKQLPLLEYSVDVLGDAEDVGSPGELDAKRYGVIVENGGRRGLLLPDLDGVDTPEQQIAIAKRKAGIEEGESVKLQRFEVARHV